jgi:hypothetical protein
VLIFKASGRHLFHPGKVFSWDPVDREVSFFFEGLPIMPLPLVSVWNIEYGSAPNLSSPLPKARAVGSGGVTPSAPWLLVQSDW